jgi:putative salt-induced outer membrane protein YdiY
MPLRRPPILAALALAGAATFPVAASARAKTDLVFLNNGDRMTGEIKQLDRGILKLSTNDIGTLNIEWEDVDSLNSVYQFRVEDHVGTKYFGAIFLTHDGMLQVIKGGQAEEASQINVVAITPLEASFWQQLDGSISLGFSYTKSNSLAQLTGDLYVRRRTPIRLFELEMSAIATAQEGQESSQRNDFSFTYDRLFEGALFVTTSAGTQTNDELGLDLRVQLSSGLGAKLIQSNHNDLLSSAGLSVNREWSGYSDGGYNLEAFVSARHSVFRYDYPKTDITSEITVYPSLTSWGRVRSEIDISASREVVKDFTVTLSFYDSYDSDPLDPDANKNDYGLVASLGWTF